jgi:hypothetical protein
MLRASGTPAVRSRSGGVSAEVDGNDQAEGDDAVLSNQRQKCSSFRFLILWYANKLATVGKTIAVVQR